LTLPLIGAARSSSSLKRKRKSSYQKKKVDGALQTSIKVLFKRTRSKKFWMVVRQVFFRPEKHHRKSASVSGISRRTEVHNIPSGQRKCREERGPWWPEAR